MSEDPFRVGVIGVGSMGQNHARVYNELPGTTLVGVADADAEQAAEIAADHDVPALSMGDLLAEVDGVSIAVPTQFHYETAKRAIEQGVHTLIEKPFVESPARGRELIALADDHDVALQVGHIERFNPAVAALRRIAPDLDVIAIHAERLGPPLDRSIADSVVMDLMIHDLDIVLDLLGEDVQSVNATGIEDGDYAVANLGFDSGVVCHLAASRVTQEKVRGLSISAENCRVKVDYIDQSVEIHRGSKPSYIQHDGDVHYHHENVVEKLTVDRYEPLKEELRAFTDAATEGTEPVVTGEDGLRVLELAQDIDAKAGGREKRRTPVHSDD